MKDKISVVDGKLVITRPVPALRGVNCETGTFYQTILSVDIKELVEVLKPYINEGNKE
jgi:hypothetical protein